MEVSVMDMKEVLDQIMASEQKPQLLQLVHTECFSAVASDVGTEADYLAVGTALQKAGFPAELCSKNDDIQFFATLIASKGLAGQLN